jgi:hypothetical protein
LVFSSDRAEFGFKIEFVRGTKDPSRVFRAFSGLIDFCQVTDKTLIKSLDLDIEPDLRLDNIEQGSIIVWLKNVLKSANENTLHNLNLKLVSSHLVEAKSYIIKFINQRPTIKNTSEFSELKEKLMSSAKKTNVNELGIYTTPSDKDLLLSIDKFQLASSELQSADKLYYLTRSSNLPVNHDFCISPESRDKLLVKDTIKSVSKMILKVKKPDYLGESKWECRHNRRAIDVKINDLDWLKKFRRREVIIAPGDAVEAQVEIISKYDFQGELISTQYTIQKVIAVIPMALDNQLPLFNDQNLGSH